MKLVQAQHCRPGDRIRRMGPNGSSCQDARAETIQSVNLSPGRYVEILTEYSRILAQPTYCYEAIEVA